MKLRYQCALAMALLCLGQAGARAETAGPGVIVEEVGQGSTLERVGLRAGDLLLSWERPPERGEIRTISDWLRLKDEQAPRGDLRLRGERSGEDLVLEIPKGDWTSRVRPRMADDLLATYAEGRKRVEAGDVEAAADLWERLARIAPDLKPWLLLQTGEAWSNAGNPEKARAALQSALEDAADPEIRVAVLEDLGQSYQTASDMARAEPFFREALEISQAERGDSLQRARLISRLGVVKRRQNRMDEAAQLLQESLEMRQRLAPDSLDLAKSLEELSALAWAKGDPQTFYDLSRRALAIEEKWAPDTLETAGTLNYVAISAVERGLIEEGRAAFQRALAIQERLAPGSLTMARALTNLGSLARETGDLDAAEELHRRALAIQEKLAPESSGAAVGLSSLAQIARDRGDLDKAVELFQRSLDIWAKAAPQGLGVAANLNALGGIERMRGNLDKAWELHSRALEMREKVAPGSLDATESLRDLARVAELRGDLEKALELYRQITERYQRLAPGTIEDAMTFQSLGRIHRRQGHLDQAAQFLTRAIDALESQVGRLGGSYEMLARFRAAHEGIYRDAVEVELARGHEAEAFHLEERSRARSFLTLLAQRDLDFRDVPAELETARRDNAERYDLTQRDLSRWSPSAGAEAREALVVKLADLRRERDQIAERIRRASPRVAALREPQPLDAEGARKVLDPGTLALSYSVGKEQTVLFALTREGGLRVKVLPVGEETLRREVESFLERVRKPEAGSADDLSRSLYRELIRPVADLVAASDRLLILPDGPLHRLPFRALRADRFLIEQKPLHTALSLTVYAAVRASTEPPGAAKLVAFGDPRFPKSAQGKRDLGPALRGFNWAPLPNTRREVERIAQVYPGASLYLGDQATEERAKSVGRDVRVLHFATHGYTDDRSPLDSALVLTMPEELSAGRDNGLLQAWEIFEDVRLDADLVVLSSCESALGRELGGEGLIGLTRAFQYAGARSVVASLWSVADRVTAELMTRFYRHYAAGLPKDEALRRAQIELIRGPIRLTTSKGQGMKMDASAPFFWAAFELFGDWR
ncbi:MAG TPA: CHAT domain-containing protein [Thermoanaerobaculia bacterium]|jgi:CHAT domain-containing protein/Tfp pilus assembly protein PilF|nr:CHAT domain-containing protein [Thermoanaerobaculia bacterium]